VTNLPESSARVAPLGHVASRESKPRLLDWLFLTLLGLLTIIFIAASVDLAARRFYVRTPDFAQICVDPGTSLTGTYAKPNSACRFKTYESQLDEYRFNRCGHRTAGDCAVKQDGVYRIVMAGSSLAMGYEIPQDKTYAWTLPMQLSQRTGHKVQLYNEAMLGHGPHVLSAGFSEILAAKPDMILWTITPFDIDTEKPDVGADLPKPDVRGGRVSKYLSILRNIFAGKSVAEGIGFIWHIEQAKFNGSPAGALVLHLICMSNTQYMKSVLQAQDTSGYLRTVPSDDWRRRLQLFDSDTDKIASQARSAGVPLVVVFVPNRPQVLMASMSERPAGYDPDQLDREVETIVEKHGAKFIDMLPSFRAIPNPERLYYPVDGHPDAHGHAFISDALAKELSDGLVPALKSAPGQSNR
jgi:hypothetical protein